MKKYNILMKKKIILFFYFISFQEKTTSIKIRELLENSNTPKKRSSLDDTACLPSNFTTEKVPVFAIRSTCTKDKFTYLHVLWYFFPFTSLLFSLQVGCTIVEKVTDNCFRRSDVNSNQNWNFSLSFKSDRSTVLFVGLKFLTRSSEFDRTIDRF